MKNRIRLLEDLEVDNYDQWIKENERDSLKTNVLSYSPLITVIVPVYHALGRHLVTCIESVRAQTYQNWELWLIGDVPAGAKGKNKLKAYEDVENIHIDSGITANDGIRHAKGEFIAFMDCDDVIASNALYEFAEKLNENPEYDFIYSDEDQLSRNGEKRHTPFFKPDWSPDTFMDMMYTGHLALYRKDIVDKTGGFRPEFGGSQDYDLTLRFMELSDDKKVGHVPKVLYHRREHKASVVSGMAANSDAPEAGRRAKEEAMQRRGYHGYTEYVEDANQYRVVYENPKHDKVSIIIPSKDNTALLYQCLRSIQEHTDYDNYEIIIVDNGSREETYQELSQFCLDNQILYHYQPMEFNFSKMCNIGAGLASGEYLLFLNDDVEIASNQWLDRMLGHAALPHVGAVGAKLLYPDTDKIQHVGVVNLKVGPAHMFMGTDDSKNCTFGRNRMNYDVLAVTGACLMVRKDKYDHVGGFDEELVVGYNDVDFCFQLYEEGFYNVVDNSLVLYHYESASRGIDTEHPEKAERLRRERELLYKKHPALEGEDPFYNKNLIQDKPDFSLYVKEFMIPPSRKLKIPKWKIAQELNQKIMVYIDEVHVSEFLNIRGWFFLVDYATDYRIAYLSLRDSNGVCTYYEVYREKREDVAKVFHSDFLYLGFRCRIPFSKLRLDKTRYQIGICFDMGKTHRNVLWWSDKWLEMVSGMDGSGGH